MARAASEGLIYTVEPLRCRLAAHFFPLTFLKNTELVVHLFQQHQHQAVNSAACFFLKKIIRTTDESGASFDEKLRKVNHCLGLFFCFVFVLIENQ